MDSPQEISRFESRRAPMPREQVERLLDQELPRRRADDYAREVFYVEMTRMFRQASRIFQWWAFPLIIAIGASVAALGVFSALHLYWARTEYAALDSEFSRMKSEIRRLAEENRAIRASMDDAARRAPELLARLEEEARMLNAISAAAEDKHKITEQFVRELEQRTAALRKAQIYFVRYAELAMNGAGQYPDPNIKKELAALSAALEALGVTPEEYKKTLK